MSRMLQSRNALQLQRSPDNTDMPHFQRCGVLRASLSTRLVWLIPRISGTRAPRAVLLPALRLIKRVRPHRPTKVVTRPRRPRRLHPFHGLRPRRRHALRARARRIGELLSLARRRHRLRRVLPVSWCTRRVAPALGAVARHLAERAWPGREPWPGTTAAWGALPLRTRGEAPLLLLRSGRECARWWGARETA